MFYDIFITLCDGKNLSPSAAAKEIGIDKSNVSKWKSKGLTPRGEALNKIADYFNVTVDYLLNKWPGSDNFPSKFTTLRNDKNLSQADIASIMGVSESDVDEYESGNIVPSALAVDKLSAYFNLPRDYFFPATENGQVVVKHYSQSNQQKQKESPTDLEGLDPEEDRGFFKIMASAKQDGLSEEDVQIALDFFRRARMQDELIEKEKGNK